MSEEHARQVAAIEALAADYTEPESEHGDIFPFNIPEETLAQMQLKWACSWQIIANCDSLPPTTMEIAQQVMKHFGEQDV